MKARNIIVAGAVAVGAGALAVKKLVSNPELNSKVKEDGKKTADSLKELGKSVGAVAKNAFDNVEQEAKSIKAEVSEKLKEKEKENSAKASEDEPEQAETEQAETEPETKQAEPADNVEDNTETGDSTSTIALDKMEDNEDEE